ncbi:hypothetical protein H7U19_07640 [Hyunsoonleella sp. SJ7]|uniref:NlpE C-terminal OB domain-containing protein n=1 Tax=Hyunsoonleella aquatilis TaxID=2762758 RepID=A0A923KGG5_9FLAO|nr:hypothetical protein [Hyunsoonleella aquatilis]MBC3758271.1 hypothetical protein [Hyunsoonleella aquatilis]
MKKLLFTILFLSTIVSCKKETKTQNSGEASSTESLERTAKQSDGLTLLKGEFVYYDGAAVLQTHAAIYGVLLTDKLEELNTQAKAFKKEPTDMVLVEIRGKITNDKHDTILWENKVEIVEILNVKPVSEEENNIVKLGS